MNVINNHVTVIDANSIKLSLPLYFATDDGKAIERVSVNGRADLMAIKTDFPNQNLQSFTMENMTNSFVNMTEVKIFGGPLSLGELLYLFSASFAKICVL